jgi:2-hydroxy-3-oxopropionate reductase
MKRKVGIIGYGFIGNYYAEKLLPAGYPLTVFDIDPKRQAVAEKLGAKTVKTPAEVVESSDAVILCLPNSEIVEAVMLGEGGGVSALRAGQIVIDTSTCRPSTAILLDKACAKKQAGFVDSPLTRRDAGQILMVGGSVENFAAAEEILACISYKYRHVGPVGCGQHVKAINQAVQAGLLAVYCETVELAKCCGVDPRIIKEYLEFDVPEVLYTQDYRGGGNLALHYKDLGYLNEIAHDKFANIPILALVHEMFKATRLSGEPDWIQAGIQTYYQRLNKGK